MVVNWAREYSWLPLPPVPSQQMLRTDEEIAVVSRLRYGCEQGNMRADGSKEQLF